MPPPEFNRPMAEKEFEMAAILLLFAFVPQVLGTFLEILGAIFEGFGLGPILPV